MKKKVYSNVGKLRCSCCGNYHYQWWMISHQKKLSKKVGCASVMFKKNTHYEILCDYGSAYDTNTYQVVDRLFAKKNHAIKRLIESVDSGKTTDICDKCLKVFIAKKYIVLTKSWFPEYWSNVGLSTIEDFDKNLF